MADLSSEDREAVSFLGNSLGPLFLYDPVRDRDKVGAVYEAFAALDAQTAADEWPFADPDVVRLALVRIGDGLASGVDDDLIWEYRRLFVGPGKKPVPPWGSVYTDREKVIFGASTLKLRAWMRKNGIANLAEDGDAEDHIGRMLLLMAWIAQHKPDLLEEYLGDHLLTWSSHYFDALEASTDHAFFGGLAALSKASLEGMQTTFGIAVEYPRFYR